MTDKHVNAVRERPILFSKPMVLALLAGTKTQTRRICKPQPVPYEWPNGEQFAFINPAPGYLAIGIEAAANSWLCPYGAPGSKLWVKETHRFWDHDFETVDVEMRADTSAKYVQWVEWLMGWPIGWTDLQPLEMAKFQAWLHSHGGF